MSARLKELQVELRGVRGRLEEWARRLGALRELTTRGTAKGAREGTAKGAREGAWRAGEAPTPAEAPRTPPAPLFHGAGADALDDTELHFEVLDTEDPGPGGR